MPGPLKAGFLEFLVHWVTGIAGPRLPDVYSPAAGLGAMDIFQFGWLIGVPKLVRSGR